VPSRARASPDQSLHPENLQQRRLESCPEGEGEMTIPRPQQWTEAEVHQLRMLAKRKVSADCIAKSLGRYVGSVKTKARELNLILSRSLKATK
jgi:uncharacterized protein YbbK (DUF523 family)